MWLTLNYENLDVSFQLIRQNEIDHHKEIQKLTFPALACHQSKGINALKKG